MASTLDPCTDMTTTAPMCNNEPVKTLNTTINTIEGDWQLRDSIAAIDKHYMLIKVPTIVTGSDNSSLVESNKLIIQGNQLSGSNFTQFLSLNIQDSCGHARIEGESIRILNSNSQILLTGWFVASETVCLDDFQLYPLASQANISLNANSSTVDTVQYFEETNIPFLATLSSNGTIVSVSVPEELIGWSIQSLDIDQYSGKIYLIVQNGTRINLVTLYKDQVVLNTQIATCQDVTKCQVLTVHFSTLYERILVSFFENSPFQLRVIGDNQVYSEYQSAQWVLLLNKDGSYVHNQRIVHSIGYTLSTPKIKFDSVGKLNSLVICESNCYLNGEIVTPNVFLLQYDYIKTSYSFIKYFIQTSGNFTFKVHSLSLERDLTINAIISGFSSVSYLIKDGLSRVMQAQIDTVYQYRFRHSDGKIIQVQKLSNSSSDSEFIPSLSTSTSNSNNFVQEQNPIVYSERNPLKNNTKELKVQSYSNYGLIYNPDSPINVTQGPKYGGNSGSPTTIKRRITRLDVRSDTKWINCLVFTYTDGNTQQFGTCNGNYDTLILDKDEYFKEMRHNTAIFAGSYTILGCIKIITNKKTFVVNDNICATGKVEYVPSGLEVIGFQVQAGAAVDSFSYLYGYSNVYSCANGYSGDNCQAPICYDVGASNALVCSGKGQCVGPNNCSSCVSTGPFDSHNCLSYGFCNDISSLKLDVCSGRGSCLYNGTCSCETSYYGPDCSVEAKCFGISKSSYGACSNHGSCLDTDLCECNVGYTGKNCELPICYGKIANSSGVCSGHGDCVKPSVCSCKTGYYGSKCQYFYCNGTASSNPSVCSSRGKCADYNKCVCSEGFYGQNCELYNCSGVANTDSNVCSANGLCIAIDNCTCTNPRSYGSNCEKCENGYFGAHCEKWTCGGVENSSPNVCNSRGVCKSFDNCQCESENIKGQFCESCITGYFGEKCNNWTCGGVSNTNSSVCNYRGVCSSYNNCECNTRSNGTTCEKCIGYFGGQTCGSCIGSHFGDDCYNFIESNKAPYVEDMEIYQGRYLNIYGFRVTTNTNFRYALKTIDCSKVFQNVNELTKQDSYATCRVKEIGLNLDKKSYRYNVEFFTVSTGVLFNPRNPIMFNVMWSSNKNASYELVNLDISDFLKNNQPSYSGLSVRVSNSVQNSNTINRCFESKILATFTQPEAFGTFQSLRWELTGKSIALLNNSLVKQALEDGQNKLEWTLPYLPNILQYMPIEMSATVTTYFGLTYTRTASFSLGGSYRRSSYYFERKTVLITSREVSLPLAQYFSENLECIDGTSISYTVYAPSKVLNSYYSLKMTEKNIVFSPLTTSMYMFITITMYDGTVIPINFNPKPPTVGIMESMVVYKQNSIPSITLTCKYYYGKDTVDIPQMMLIMENNQVLKRMMMAQTAESYSLPVNQLYENFNLSIPHTFTVACLRSSDYVNSDLSSLMKIFTMYDSLLPVIGKATQVVSFIPDTHLDYSSCKVLGATLTGLKSNVIPFSDEPNTYFLEILTTQASNCQVDITYLSPNYERQWLDTVSVTGSKYLVPLQFYNGNLKSKYTTVSGVSQYFTLSLLGTSDVTDTTIKITVQDPLISQVTLYGCSISPSTLEIGFTIAQLSCNTVRPLNSLFMTLLHEEAVVGTSYTFPIAFKTTKSGMNFKILFYDAVTGGKSTIPLNIITDVQFSTSNLFTSEVVSSISKTLEGPTSEIYKNNDLVISLVSNIDTVAQNNSVVSEIQKLVPLALTATTSSVTTQLDANLAQGSVTSEDLSKYINQVKVLSKPQFLTNESTASAVDMLIKFAEVSIKAAVWSSDSSNSLSEILVNVASKIPEKSTIKLATSIVNAAILLGTKTELSTSDFFPSGDKPSNLISINAVKTSVTLLNSNQFSFSNSNTSLVSFSVMETSSVQLVNIANSLFKFPTSLARNVEATKKEYVSQLTISSSISGSVHVNVPIPSYTAPTNLRTKQTFRCSVTLDFVQFETESICKSIKTSSQILTDIKPTDPTLIVDCICDLTSLSNLMNNSVIGITADYLEETTPIVDPIVSVDKEKEKENTNRNVQSGDGAAAVVILIPVLICCACFILIPIIVTIIIVKEKRKREACPPSSANQTNNTPQGTTPQYNKVQTQASISSGSPYDQFGRVNSNTAFNQQPNQLPYNIAMTTYAETSFENHQPSTI